MRCVLEDLGLGFAPVFGVEPVLVDLVRFELTTSSMPFKKYQSLADIWPKQKT